MRANVLLTGLAMLALLAGCQDREAYNLELEHAQTALNQGFPEMADEHLTEADRIATKEEFKPVPAQRLLAAEVQIQLGDLDRAEQLALQVSREYVPGRVENAQAEEVLAKIDIRRGRFADALTHLNQAERSYKAEADKKRVADLIYLVRGFNAYGDGETRIAKAHWQNISDPEIRASVEATLARAAQ